jgi:hypothetical protein
MHRIAPHPQAFFDALADERFAARDEDFVHCHGRVHSSLFANGGRGLGDWWIGGFNLTRRSERRRLMNAGGWNYLGRRGARAVHWPLPS